MIKISLILYKNHCWNCQKKIDSDNSEKRAFKYSTGIIKYVFDKEIQPQNFSISTSSDILDKPTNLEPTSDISIDRTGEKNVA